MPLPAFQGQGLNTRWPAHPLLRNVTGLLRLLNAITVVLVGLVVGGVVGRLGHDYNFESEKGQSERIVHTQHAVRSQDRLSRERERFFVILMLLFHCH